VISRGKGQSPGRPQKKGQGGAGFLSFLKETVMQGTSWEEAA